MAIALYERFSILFSIFRELQTPRMNNKTDDETKIKHAQPNQNNQME